MCISTQHVGVFNNIYKTKLAQNKDEYYSFITNQKVEQESSLYFYLFSYE